jgi:DNA-binding IclR family transcriptional regulator
MRRDVLLDIAANPGSPTGDVVRRLQVPRKTIDRTLQELHLLGLLVVDELTVGQTTRWIYSLAGNVSTGALERLAGNVSTPAKGEAGG